MKYSTFYCKYGFPLLQMVLRRPTLQMARQFKKSEYLDGKQIRKKQLEVLKQLYRHAKNNIPFYNKKYSKLPINEINTFEEFSTLPVLDRSEVSKNYKDMLAKGIHSSDVILSRTGGSSGEPLSFYTTPHSSPLGLALMMRARAWWDIDFNDRNALFIEHGLKFEDDLRSRFNIKIRNLRERLLNRVFFSAYQMSPVNLKTYYDSLIKFRPVYLIGYASFLYLFAKYIQDNRLNSDTLGVRCIFYTSEMLYTWQRSVIESVFRCPVVCEYGLKEVGVVAYECPSKNIHTMDESVYVEVIPLEDNSRYGEIVVTQLQMSEAPFIRYRTGDLAEVVDSEKLCDCGRGLHLMGAVQGRSHDWIITPSGKTIHGQIFTHALIVHGNVEKFRVYQSADYSIRIEVVVNKKFNERNERMIIENLESVISEPIPISLHKVNDISPGNSGKFRWIKSEIGVYERPTEEKNIINKNQL